MTLHRVLVIVLCIAIGGCGAPPLKGKMVDRTYFSPDGEFSIVLAESFRPVQETVFADQTSVDILFEGDMTFFPVFGLETIEWLKLRRDMTATEFSSTAPSLAREHVAQRFAANGSFEFAQGEFVSGNDGAYRFLAIGTLRDRHTTWIGQINHYGDRIAIVSFVQPEGGIGKPIQSLSGVSRYLSAWLSSVRRER